MDESQLWVTSDPISPTEYPEFKSFDPSTLSQQVLDKYEITETGKTGFNSGRKRFRVFCKRCKVEIHPNTTWPEPYMQDHDKAECQAPAQEAKKYYVYLKEGKVVDVIATSSAVSHFDLIERGIADELKVVKTIDEVGSLFNSAGLDDQLQRWISTNAKGVGAKMLKKLSKEWRDLNDLFNSVKNDTK